MGMTLIHQVGVHVFLGILKEGNEQQLANSMTQLRQGHIAKIITDATAH
jgi:hypothetical protein